MTISYCISSLCGTLLMLIKWNQDTFPDTRWGFVSILLKLFVLCYDIAKASLYYSFLIRIQIAFYNSSYQYSKHLLNACKVLVISFILVMGTCDIFFSFTEYEEYSDGHTNYTLFAQGYTGYEFLLFQIVFDPFFTVLTLVLFMRPLYKLLTISKVCMYVCCVKIR